MIRLAATIVVLAAIAAALVQLRREEARVRHEIQRCISHQMVVRRKLWGQRVRIGWLIAPSQARRRADEMALDLTDEDESRRRLAASGDPSGGAGNLLPGDSAPYPPAGR